MRQVTETLWVGNARDARDMQLLHQHDIDTVVDVALEEPPVQTVRNMNYLRIPLVDGGGNQPSQLELAVHCLEQALRQECRVLVACSAGMSRSPAVAAAALARLRDGRLESALRLVTQSGPSDVAPDLVSDLRQLLEESR